MIATQRLDLPLVRSGNADISPHTYSGDVFICSKQRHLFFKVNKKSRYIAHTNSGEIVYVYLKSHLHVFMISTYETDNLQVCMVSIYEMTKPA